jgi:hypothetical protein
LSFDHMSVSRPQRKFVIAAGIGVALVLCAAALLPALARSSNCGGNSAALAACKGYVTVLQVWAAEHEDQRFHYDQADEETKEHLRRLPGASWIRSARLLARLEDVRVDPAAEKRIIMVCDRAYDNVPQRILGRSPMAHAVAYVTGETALISPDEFGRLDLSSFTDLQVLTVRNEGRTSGSSQ